jgi:hypothetical protein
MYQYLVRQSQMEILIRDFVIFLRPSVAQIIVDLKGRNRNARQGLCGSIAT